MPLKIQINAELERKFREATAKRFGNEKDALSKAAEEAILNWLLNLKTESPPFEGDPVKAIEGLLKGVDVDSVRLQHEIRSSGQKRR